MKKLFCFSAVLCTLICAAEVKISDRNGNILANNGEISTYLLKKNNYSFNLSARDANGANFGAVIESILWYHGRSGNTEHIYQDQSEKNFLPGKYIINHRSIRTTSSNADFEIERITEFPENTGAVTYEYILTVKESRDHGKMRFPLTRLTKEITTVSFDDGTLENFTTSAKILPEELAKTRAMLFHIPARGKTLLMLIDVNTPLKYGHRFGIMPTYAPGSWTAPAGTVTVSAELEIPYGSEDNPVQLTENTTVTIPAGATYHFSSRANGANLIVNGEDKGVIVANMWAPYTFTITNETDADAEYVFEIVFPEGTMDNPKEIVLGENSVDIAEGAEPYYFTWTATAAGEFTITVSANTGWFYVVNNTTSGQYGDMQWSDSDPVLATCTVEVAEGDVLEIQVNTYDPANMWANPAGTVTVTAAFE